jgi:hypothetical protein
VHTSLLRLKASRKRCATVEVFWWIAFSPNHVDSYPYRSIRALGATDDSISASLSQLTYRGAFGSRLTFLHQVLSEWAPMPWIATKEMIFGGRLPVDQFRGML